MAYSSLAVANAFIKRSLDNPHALPNLTPMKLQKLMYYAQAWFYDRNNHRPLLDDYFCRWEYGPVIPSIYHEFKHFRADQITALGQTAVLAGDNVRFLYPEIPSMDVDAWFYIDEVIRNYGRLPASQLVAMTHQEGGAWAKKGADGSPILNDELLMDI